MDTVYNTTVNQLEFESLADRRKQLRLTLLFKIVNNLVDIPHDYLFTTAQQRTTGRHCVKLMTISTRTNVLKYSFFPRTVIDLNHLDEDIVSAPTAPSFKERLGSH